MIVKVKVVLQRREQIQAAGEVAGVDQLVLERAPQPFDEHVVERAPAAIHADRDSTLFERSQEVRRGELRARIGVPDFGLSEAERSVERGEAEARLHGVGKFPTEHEAAEPIHDGYQVEKAATHWNVSNIGAPDVIGPLDRDRRAAGMGRSDDPAPGDSSWAWDSELRCPECASAAGCACGSLPV